MVIVPLEQNTMILSRTCLRQPHFVRNTRCLHLVYQIFSKHSASYLLKLRKFDKQIIPDPATVFLRLRCSKELPQLLSKILPNIQPLHPLIKIDSREIYTTSPFRPFSKTNQNHIK